MEAEAACRSLIPTYRAHCIALLVDSDDKYIIEYQGNDIHLSPCSFLLLGFA